MATFYATLSATPTPRNSHAASAISFRTLHGSSRCFRVVSGRFHRGPLLTNKGFFCCPRDEFRANGSGGKGQITTPTTSPCPCSQGCTPLSLPRRKFQIFWTQAASASSLRAHWVHLVPSLQSPLEASTCSGPPQFWDSSLPLSSASPRCFLCILGWPSRLLHRSLRTFLSDHDLMLLE